VKLTEGKARMKQWRGDEDGAAQALAAGVAKVEHTLIQAAALVGGAKEEGGEGAPEGGESGPEEGGGGSGAPPLPTGKG